MSWSHRSLGTLLSLSGYERAGGNDYPVLSITMNQGLIDQSDKFKKRIASRDTTRYRVVYENELVVGFPIDEGVIGFQTKYPAGIVSPAYDVWHLTDKDNTHIPYVERYLRSPQARRLYASKMQGAVARRRSLTKADFLKLEIPFPPLDDQVRIAGLLSKVEGLIAQRKQHLQQLDDLLKSIFLEMFGFCDGTYTQWSIDRLALHTEVVSGVTKGKRYTSADLIEVPYMRVANVQDGHFILDEIKTIAVTQNEIDQYQLRRGDLLLTEGGDPDKLGRGSVWEEQIPNCIHQNHIFRVRINNQTEINPYYLSALVGSPYGKAYFLRSAKQTTGIASINSTQLKNFPTLIPPIDLQNNFAAIVEKLESIKSNYQKSLADLEHLYRVLSQEAFKGELDLSRVPLPLEQSVPETKRHDETGNFPIYLKGAGGPKAIQLPAPVDLIDLTSTKGREATIHQWLDAYLTQISVGETFSSSEFLAAAQQRVEDLLENDPPNLALDAYEQIKAWVFQALENRQLMQNYDDDGNRVQLSSARN